MPAVRRQPSLLFAAGRYLLGPPPALAALRALASDRAADLAGTMMTRRTQTNEPARCATRLPGKYSYDYAGHRVAGTDPGAPVLACEPRGPVPLPERVPDVAWRAGLDLNPLDVTSDDDVRWLQCLVWPGETGRLGRLGAAVETARRDPPPMHRGDLLTDVPDLVRQAPRGATVVVYHSAVLSAGPERQRGGRAHRLARHLGRVAAVTSRSRPATGGPGA